MTGRVSYYVENEVVWLGLSDDGPVEVSSDFAEDLLGKFSNALNEPGVRCIVLSGAPNGFPRGFSNTNMPATSVFEALSEVINRIEASPIPVVAVIPDAAINEGLEVALAAHYRVSSRNARFGINHIATGLIPGLGGTQRLPRLTGAKTALEILLNGKLQTADQALKAGLVDLVVEDKFSEETGAFVQEVVSQRMAPRPTGKLVSGQSDPLKYQAQMKEAKKLVEGFRIPAAKAIVDCVEAAQLMPLETGLGFERSLFEECLQSDEANALRHVAISERRLSRPGRRSATFVSACVLAAKPEDAGLCVALLDSGLEVKVVDHLPPPHPSMAGSIIGIYDQAVKNGRMSPEVRSSRVARLDVVQLNDKDVHADVYIDAGRFPQSEVLEWVNQRLSATEQEQLVLTSRTSQESKELAEDLCENARCVAFYFEKAPHIAKVVEIFPVSGQSNAAIEDVEEFFRIVKRMPVVTENSQEPVSSLIRHRLFETAEALLLNGAEPKQIDGALGEFGFRIGPLAMRDDVGLEMDLVPGQQPATESLIKSGRTGRNAGLGYFRYAKGDDRPRPDGVVVWSLSSTRDNLGIEPQEFSDEEVVSLVVGALANLGAKLVDEDIVQRVSDIDVLAIHGLRFPRHRGGPMQAAEQLGLFKIARVMEKYAHLSPEIWTTHPLINELVKYGQGFEEMNLPDLEVAS